MRSLRWKLIGGVLLGMSAQLSAIGLLLAAAWLIVRAAEHPPVLYLMVAIVAVRFFGISRSVLRYGERLVTHDVAFADAVDQRIVTYQELDRVAPRGLQRWRRGDVVSRVVADVDELQNRLLRVNLNWWTGIAATVVVVGVVTAIDLTAGLTLGLAALGLALVVRVVLSPASARARTDTVHASGDLAAEVSAAAIAAMDLVALDATESARKRAGSATARLASDQDRGARFGGVGSALVLLITGVSVFAMAQLTGSVVPVVVGVLMLAPIALGESWDGWIEAERFRPDTDAAAQRLAALTDTPTPVSDPDVPVPSGGDVTLTAHDLVAGWDTPLFEPCSFTLAVGGTLGLSAPSGAGKSTLAFTLLRLIEPIDGIARIGGTDITEMAASDVRSIVGYVGQDEVVFDTTIRENLRIADPDAEDEGLWRALRLAGLADFVRGLSEGLDAPVGERGGYLSGGERQRLCVARLLLSGHRVWILDEPTEHLDGPTAAALLEDVLALTKAEGEPVRAIVVISHVQSVLARCDRVLELEPQRRASHQL